MSDKYDAAGAIRDLLARLEKDHSRGELASMAGVTPTVISDFMNGREKQPQIGLDKVTRLARALRRPVAELFAGAPDADGVSSSVTGVREVHVDDGSAHARVVELEGQNRALAEKVRAYEDVLNAVDESVHRYHQIVAEDRPPDQRQAERRKRR